MDLQQLKNKILDLEKGYKQLTFWHDKNKYLHHEALINNKRSLKVQQEMKDVMQIMTQSIVEINERLQRLEEKT
jgi:hypothetical protein